MQVRWKGSILFAKLNLCSSGCSGIEKCAYLAVEAAAASNEPFCGACPACWAHDLERFFASLRRRAVHGSLRDLPSHRLIRHLVKEVMVAQLAKPEEEVAMS